MKKLALALLLLLGAAPSFAQSVVDPEVPNRKVTNTLGALNATASVSMQGRQSASLRITTANLNATVDFQCSLDGGVTYVTTGNGCGAWGGDQADGDVFSVFQQNFVFDGAAHTTVFALEAMSGVTNYRVIVSAYTSGTASAIITATMAPPFHTFVSVDNAVVISGGVVASGALIDDTGPYVPSASDNNGFHMLGVRNDAGALTLTSGDRNASPLAVDSKGRIGITLLGGSDLGVDGSGHTQPVSGTFWQATQPVSGTFWQATQPVSGTFFQATQPISAAALPLPSGASTSALQTTGNTSLASIAAALAGTITVNVGLTDAQLRASAVPVSGTFFQATQPISAAALPLPAGASTAAKQPALGTAGTASADVITVQGKAAMTPILVDGSGTPLPVSGTVTANIGTSGSLQLNATGAALNVAPGTSNVGITGPMVQANVDTGAPTYTNGNVDPLSMTTKGGLRVSVTNTSGTSITPASESTLGLLPLAQASTTSGESGVLALGAATTAAPSYTTAQTNPLSLQLDGSLRTAVTNAIAVTNAGLTNIDVALSTRTKPADQQHALLDANSGVDIGKLTANQSVDLNKVVGTTTSVNSGNADAGSQRVAVAGFGTIATSQTTCANTATLIAAARGGRAAINVTMVGAVDVYLGTSGVTTTTGDLLLGTKGTSRSLPTSAAVYCIVASGTVVVSATEAY